MKKDRSSPAYSGKRRETGSGDLAKLERGISFDHLAKRYSKCPSGRNGGDLGEFQQGAMVGPFDRAVFSCPLLKPYGPVKTKFGYHIIKVLYRR